MKNKTEKFAKQTLGQTSESGENQIMCVSMRVCGSGMIAASKF